MYPHCDQRVLHAPGQCVYCDRFSSLQEARLSQRVNFTGQSREGFSQCPAERERALDAIERWGGNVARAEAV